MRWVLLGLLLFLSLEPTLAATSAAGLIHPDVPVSHLQTIQLVGFLDSLLEKPENVPQHFQQLETVDLLQEDQKPGCYMALRVMKYIIVIVAVMVAFRFFVAQSQSRHEVVNLTRNPFLLKVFPSLGDHEVAISMSPEHRSLGDDVINKGAFVQTLVAHEGLEVEDAETIFQYFSDRITPRELKRKLMSKTKNDVSQGIDKEQVIDELFSDLQVSEDFSLARMLMSDTQLQGLDLITKKPKNAKAKVKNLSSKSKATPKGKLITAINKALKSTPATTSTTTKKVSQGSGTSDLIIKTTVTPITKEGKPISTTTTTTGAVVSEASASDAKGKRQTPVLDEGQLQQRSLMSGLLAGLKKVKPDDTKETTASTTGTTGASTEDKSAIVRLGEYRLVRLTAKAGEICEALIDDGVSQIGWLKETTITPTTFQFVLIDGTATGIKTFISAKCATTNVLPSDPESKGANIPPPPAFTDFTLVQVSNKPGEKCPLLETYPDGIVWVQESMKNRFDKFQADISCYHVGPKIVKTNKLPAKLCEFQDKTPTREMAKPHEAFAHWVN